MKDFRPFLRFLVLVICPNVPCAASAYDTITHTRISTRAVEISSALSDPSSRFSEWGVKKSAAGYVFPRQSTGQMMSVVDLIAEAGAVDEDSGKRARNHFFDPIGEKPLSFPFREVELGNTSVQWAVNGEGQPSPGDSPNYSYAGARRAFLRALTRRDEADRLTEFGLLFETLGHVIHHIQDMAQPQHARNDFHLEFPIPGRPFDLEFIIERKSRYEYWAKTNVVNITAIDGLEQLMTATKGFKTADSFWKAPGSNIGIASFANRNFVTQQTNFVEQGGAILPNSYYSFPVPHGLVSRPIRSTLEYMQQKCPNLSEPVCSLEGTMDFVSTTITDELAPQHSSTNHYASALSIFTQDLKLRSLSFPAVGRLGMITVPNTTAMFTLNPFTFNEAAKVLVPRAVAYSAGLMNFFFRGKISLALKPNSDQYVEFKNLGEEALTGEVKVYYDAEDGRRYPVPLASPWLVSNLGEGEKAEFEIFQVPVDPLPKTQGVYLVVFTGTMGEEEPLTSSVSDSPGAVVANKVKLPMPELYWAQTVRGQFELSYSLPERLEKLFVDDFDLGQLRVNSVPTILDYYVSDGCGYVGDQRAWQYLEAAHDPGSSPVISLTHYPDNRVVYHNFTTGQAFIGAVANFKAIHEDVNYQPVCSNSITNIQSPVGDLIKYELSIGTRSILSFCARLSYQPPAGLNDEEQRYDFMYTKLKVRGLKGVRVHEDAVMIEQESGACP